MLSQYIEQICDIFEKTENRYDVHTQCQPILSAMAKDRAVLYEIIKQNLVNPAFLSRTRHYSTLSMAVYEHSDFSMVINIFPPLPNRNTDITFQSIHHHGNLLLSTVSFFGPGYSSIVYKKGFEINKDTHETNLEIEKIYENHLYQLEFCDSHQPHVVFYPTDFSSTLVIWSDDKRNLKNTFKKFGFLKKIKPLILKVLKMLRLSAAVGINKIEYFDFYRENGVYYGLKDRLAYDDAGSNYNFLENIFCFLQKFGFDDMDFLKNLKNLEAFPKEAHGLIDDYIAQCEIKDVFYEKHLNVPHVNLHRKDLLT
jgi:hypothetical protein